MTKPPYHDDQASFSAPIEDLQVRITFLDDLVEQLNQQLAIQTQEIADLKNKCNFFINVWNLQIYQKALHLLIH